MEEMEIHKLIGCCVDYFTGACYTLNRIHVYHSIWRRGILRYMEDSCITMYSSTVGQDFIRQCIPARNNLTPKERELIRGIQVLDDYLNLGYIRKSIVVPVQHRLDGLIGVEMQKLINHLTILRRCKDTINGYKLSLSSFLGHLTNEGVASVDEISECHILRFISTKENNKINVASALRVLFRYWYTEHIISIDHESILKAYKWKKKERIPSCYTSDELKKNRKIRPSEQRCQ